MMSAMEIRLAMAAEGWRSHDKITSFGWSEGMGYSVWFERSEWHGKNALALTGNFACYHAHTPDLSKIDETTQRAADLARKAYAEWPDMPPSQGLKGQLTPSYHAVLCRVCQKKPREPGVDHCCGPDCVPF